MKIKELKKEELENMAYDDIAFMVLDENGKKMKIQTLFKKICSLLDLDENKFEDHIADFFELLSTDNRFIMLPNGYWDLKRNHSHKMDIEEDDDVILDQPEETLEDEEDDLFYESEETDDQEEDDLKDLVIIDSNDEENEDL